MAVTIKDVEHIAALARLEFTEEEKEKLAHQMNQILEYMAQLNKLDTSNVEPLSHVIELGPAAGGIFRDDVPRSGISTEEALKNAPAKDEQFFKVPKVISEKD